MYRHSGLKHEGSVICLASSPPASGSPGLGSQRWLTQLPSLCICLPHQQHNVAGLQCQLSPETSLGSTSALPPPPLLLLSLLHFELRVICTLLRDTPIPIQTNGKHLVGEVCTFLNAVSPTETQHSCSLK